MSLFACHSLVIEGACGTIAMDAYVEILQKIKPLGVFHISCEESYNLLPAVIRLRKAEEEKEHTIAAIFGERK